MRFCMWYDSGNDKNLGRFGLAPWRPRCHFVTAIFNLVLLIGIFTSSKDNALRWMPRDLIDDKSTLVQVMALCRPATSHYLSQRWHSSMSPYGVTRPEWVYDRNPIMKTDIQAHLWGICQWNLGNFVALAMNLIMLHHAPLVNSVDYMAIKLNCMMSK